MITWLFPTFHNNSDSLAIENSYGSIPHNCINKSFSYVRPLRIINSSNNNCVTTASLLTMALGTNPSVIPTRDKSSVAAVNDAIYLENGRR